MFSCNISFISPAVAIAIGTFFTPYRMCRSGRIGMLLFFIVHLLVVYLHFHREPVCRFLWWIKYYTDFTLPHFHLTLNSLSFTMMMTKKYIQRWLCSLMCIKDENEEKGSCSICFEWESSKKVCCFLVVSFPGYSSHSLPQTVTTTFSFWKSLNVFAWSWINAVSWRKNLVVIWVFWV